jgi:STE24 endopeptidase
MNEDKATRYHRLKRQASLASLVWVSALLVGLMLTGASQALGNVAERLADAVAPTSCHAAAVVVFYVIGVAFLNETGAFPLAALSGFVLERRYGLSNEPFRAWLRDQAKSFAVGLILACGGASVLYGLVRFSPDRWWLLAGVVFSLIIVGLTNLAPVLFLPLFYRVKPLERESLRERLLSLAERAGARVLGTYEWGLSDKTKKANAALTGLGATRRILVSDTMLAEYSDEEIEIVLAHELAHHVHGDIWKGIVLESALILAGFYLASRLLASFASTFQLRGVADIAGLPLLLLAAGAVSLAMLPAAHAVSRGFERRADLFALDLTRNPAAFISAMRRLAAQNLAEEHPSKLVQWLFYSHPPYSDRISAARRHTPTA